CLLLSLVGSACTSAAAFPPLPAFDRNGEPLSAGAVGRLGTIQLRSDCKDLHFSPDGRTLVGITEDRVAPVWDARTGGLLESRGLPGPGRGTFQPWFQSADGRTLLVNRVKALELIDLSSRQSLGTHRPTLHGIVQRMAVSDDRRWLLFPDVVG